MTEPKGVILISIDFNRKCSSCGNSGVVKNGLCIGCIAAGVRRGDVDPINKSKTSVNGEPLRGYDQLEKGDRILVRIPTRSGLIKGWRVVTGRMGPHLTIRAHGYGDFIVHDDEISDCKKRGGDRDGITG